MSDDTFHLSAAQKLAEDPSQADHDRRREVIENARKELDELEEQVIPEQGGPRSTAGPSKSGTRNSDLAEAKRAAKKRRSRDAEGDVTRRDLASSPAAMAAFAKNLPDGTTLDDAINQLDHK